MPREPFPVDSVAMSATLPRLCLFDAYGTLFDLESVVAGVVHRVGDAAPSLSRLWRQKQLEYTWLRTLMDRYAPFDEVTADALRYALAILGIVDPSLEAALLASYGRVAPYPEVPAALHALRGAGVACGVLSNGTPAMLESALGAGRLTEFFAHVLSVDAVRRYKPDPRVYELGVASTGVPKEEIAFVSSNPWDAAGAASFGFRVVWVNRAGAPAEPLPGRPWAVVDSLAGLADALGIAAAGRSAPARPCPACGFSVFTGVVGTAGRCPVCGWVDDLLQLVHPDLAVGANAGHSLRAAQRRALEAAPLALGRFGAYLRDPAWRPLRPGEDPGNRALTLSSPVCFLTAPDPEEVEPYWLSPPPAEPIGRS